MGAGAEAALTVLLRLRNEMSGQLAGIKGQLQGLAQSAGAVGMGLTAGVTLPLALIAKQAISTAADFESQMNVLTVAARSSGTSMQDLSKAALTVGKDTQLIGINASEAADAMTNFYKAGLSTSDIFGGQLNQYLSEGTNLTGALRSAVDLAAASELDLNAASMLTATSMATFGLNAEEAGRIANSFVGAADASTASVGDLAAAMEQIGPTAAAFGWSLEQTNTALALLSTRGIMGAEAGTALKSMMTNMMRDTKDVKAAWASLNISLYDAQGNLKELPAIIGELSTAMAGMTEEQRNNYVQTLAGTYGMKAMNTLLAEGTPGWNAMTEAIANAATAQEVAAARTQGWNAAMEQLQGAVETLFIQVLTPILQSVLTPLVQKITEAVNWFTALDPVVQKVAVAFLAVLAAIGPLLLGVSGVIKAVTMVQGLFATLGPVIAAVGGALAPLLPILAAVAVAAGVLYLAWNTNFLGIRDTVTNVVASVGQTLGALGQYFLAVVKDGDYLNDWLTHLPDSMQPVVLFLGTTLANVIDAAKQTLWALGYAGRDVMTFLRGEMTWDELLLNLQGTMEAIKGYWGPAWENIKAAAENVWNELKAAAPGIWEGIKATIMTAAEALVPALATIWANVKAKAEEAWNALKTSAPGIWAAIKAAITTAAEAIAPVLAGIWENIKARATEAWGALKGIAESTWAGVKAAIAAKADEILGTVLKWLDDTLYKIENFDLKGAAEKFFGTILPGILAKAAEALEAVGKWLQDTFEKIGKFDLKGASEATFQTVVAGIAEKAGEILASVGTFLTDAAEKIRSYEFKSHTMQAFQTVVSGILEKTGEILSTVGNILSDIGSAISSFNLADAGRALIDGFIGGIREKAAAAVEAAKGVVSSAIQGAKNLLGIKSPSTVFRAIGVQAMAGLALGLGDVKSTMEALGRHVSAIVSELERLANSVISPAAVASAKAVTDPLKVIMENVAGIIGGVTELAGFKAPGSLVGLLTDLAQTVTDVVKSYAELAGTMAREGVDVGSAKAVSDPLKIIFENIASIVEGVTAIAEYAGKKFTGDMSGAITQIVDLVDGMVQGLSAAALHVGDLGTVAALFAENAAPVIGLVEEGLNALTAMGDWVTVDWGPVSSGISQLTTFLEKLVGWIGFAGKLVETKLQESAKTFAENAGPVVGLVVDGLGALAAMAAWEVVDWGPVSAAIPQLTTFLERLTGWIGLAGRLVGAELQVAARSFAENAGPVVDLVGGGLAALATMSAWEGNVNFVQIDTAAQRLGTFIKTLAGWFEYYANRLGGEAMAAAKAFAEAAGPVTDVVAGGLEALAALAGADMAVNFVQIDTAVQRLGMFIKTLIGWFQYYANQLGTEALAAASAFGAAAEAVAGSVKTAIEALNALGDYVAVPRDVMDQFIADMEYLIGQITDAASQLTADGMAQAQAFGAAAAGIASMVNTGVKALIGEDGVMFYHAVAHETIDLFISDMTYIVDELITLAAKYKTEGLTQASELANTMADIGTALNKGVAGLIKPQGTKTETVTISDYAGVAHETIDLFVADMEYIIGKVQEAAVAFTERGLALALAFAESGKGIFDAISKGVKAAVGIADTGAGEVESFRGAMAAIVQIIRDAVSAIDGILISMVTGAYSAGASFTSNLAAGIRSTIPELEAALAEVDARLPHSPAQKGPLSRAPNWNSYLFGDLLPAATRVGQALAGGLEFGGAGVTRAPAPVTFGGGGGGAVQFVYAPQVSLASQREAEEVIAPVIARVLARESRRR